VGLRAGNIYNMIDGSFIIVNSFVSEVREAWDKKGYTGRICSDISVVTLTQVWIQ